MKFKRYAKGFFFLVFNSKKEIFLKNEIEQIFFLIRKNYIKKIIFNTHFFKKKEKIIFFKRLMISNFLLKLIKLLINDNRELLFISICLEYLKIFKKKLSIIDFFFLSKKPIIKYNIIFLLKKIDKTYIINNNIDNNNLDNNNIDNNNLDNNNIDNNNLIGGLLIKVEYQYCNFTINNFLKKIKNYVGSKIC
ncbi:F0F1 ATP synthase subunit delta [Candidatus Karelsulcia muelleri]|uniref:F0F1 ATP synthase subunit delta n=1 Tax=Candidatus Karelsulcia muelleri TaxID=336810 RepID=UPI000B92E585|nr:F0F1 ATP synthase subunit delta [Candidatus Karelsulcia muelleri]ASS46832.1 F0F1 ATP synthase subunit delta [Candidatus Karelsulcia muelleri]